MCPSFTKQQQMMSLSFSTPCFLSHTPILFSKPKLSRRHNGLNTVKGCGVLAAIDDVWTLAQKSLDLTKAHLDVPILQDKDILEKTCAKLLHRGPDGMITSMGQFNKGTRWSMGHTRLAIVDPDNRKADMPFEYTFDDRNIRWAANGEIYNHEKVYHDISSGSQYWPYPKISKSDCEVIGHAYAKYVNHDDVESYEDFVKRLDGMFAFVLMEENKATGDVRVFAARDSVGIKPLYYARTKGSGAWMFSSELKALVGHVDPETVVAIPPGHYWTPQTGLVRFYRPEWLLHDDYEPWNTPDHIYHHVTENDIREAFTKAIEKRMMADVDYGFFLSGGIDSCCVAHVLLPLWRAERVKRGDYRPIKTFTVGMANSPDVMAAKGMVEALGGSKYIEHNVREFTPDEVFDLIPKIIYHMETYEAELIRSSIPNWLLAERAAQDVKMVLTGEGADELFAGYLYFQDAQSPKQVQNELKRIYSMLGNVNLHRTDRMTMAHGLEARVPFLDTEFTKLVMSVNPEKKMVNSEAVKTNSRGREKTFLREIFEGPNANGDYIPKPVLWRAKAMQCEGVGQDWVSILQNKIASLVSDEEMADAPKVYPINTPHTKEELYYRKLYDGHFHGMEHVVKLWEGGGRAMGAEWKSNMYTRTGLKNTSILSHALQAGNENVLFDGSTTNAPKQTATMEATIKPQQVSQNEVK